MLLRNRRASRPEGRPGAGRSARPRWRGRPAGAAGSAGPAGKRRPERHRLHHQVWRRRNRGTAFAHGQLLPIAQNTALFSLLGTKYGGNGTTNFALPDMRGLEPAGVNYVICLGGIYPARN
ncbi:MAG TPA: tail fiber protein [Myxococcaceae bacterium]|nr:tail fiber protein [Myxococcaceae bacterium]